MLYINISCVFIQNISCGYTATIDPSNNISYHNVKIPSDTVNIECVGYKIEYLKATDDECSVARILWINVFPILNTENGMIKILEKSFRVK